MTPASLSPGRDTALQAALFALGVFLPFSSAGVSVSLFVLLVLALCAAPTAVWRCRPWREPTVAIGLVLLAYIAVHTLVVTGWTERSAGAVNKYHELLMLPILFALFRLVSRREVFLWGLAAGSLALALAYWLVPLLPAMAGDLDQRRISAGFVLTVFAFVLVDHARGTARPQPWWAIAAVLAVTALFRIEGRTGHLVLLVLAAVAAWIYSPRRWRLLALVLLPSAVIGFACVSPAVQSRAAETWTVLRSAHPDGQTSTGIRIALNASGFGVAREHLPFGVGYARYAEAQERYVQETHAHDPDWQDAVGRDWVHTPNPHNEYLMQAAGGGIVPLALFIAWLLAPALRARPSGSALLPAVVIAFAVGCAVNSLLLDFVEGHFYTALLAWLLAREASTRVP